MGTKNLYNLKNNKCELKFVFEIILVNFKSKLKLIFKYVWIYNSLTFSVIRFEPLRLSFKGELQRILSCVCKRNVPFVFIVLSTITQHFTERVKQKPLLRHN